ncbi:MAG: cytochrome c3 family protein [Gammaproteobacteria bacterium]|nr:cytochrome c3 family protein [Gammaproteobacteria bacterium]
MRIRSFVVTGSVVFVAAVLWSSSASAARVSDIRNTKHNFSSTVTPNILGGGDQRVVRSQNESEICVFCHTPHGANLGEGPLWNREIPASSTYTVYASGSIDSTIQQPNGVSKLCLSCHDGSIAIGSVRNRAGSGGFGASAITMQGTGSGGVMAPGEGSTTGYTRFLGKDLTNDHPISLTYNSALVSADREMRSPTENPIRVRGLTPRPTKQDIHLQPAVANNPTSNTGQVQCVSCHDPHIRDTTNENIKFLRLNRLQKTRPDGSNTFLPATDIICLACHTKAGWETSAHAQPAVANEQYTNAAADVREFPRGTQVWETACLACHDTHTVQGSRRLLRAGTDAGTFASSSGYNIKNGNGSPAIEETCFACHSPNRGTLNGQGGTSFEVPDVWTDFQMARHMPITTAEQRASFEVHNIGNADGLTGTSMDGLGADFIEGPNNMGRDNVNDRHAECTDCHNPHRVVKRRSFTQTNASGGMDVEGTHDHTQPHTNIASGVLRGIWGVEPVYASESFHVDPSGFTIKRGEPTSTSTTVGSAWVTREYQVCLKCHSNFAFPNGYDGPPALGGSSTTPSGTNGMTRYTNIAREYNSPSAHAGEPRSVGTAGGASSNANNHRSWHPVMQPTQRTPASRGMASANIWLAPFRAVGTQTMYCSDCHGSNTANGTAVPSGSQPNGPVWGPHGSNNNFLLKGPWSGDRTTGTGVGQTSHLCFKCHDFAQYADPNNTAPLDSGFQLGADGGGGGGMGGMGGGDMCMGGGGMCGGMGGMDGGGGVMNNLHIFHANQVTNFRCNLCHVAVPHGWKNKNFLVNLNDVGPEGGLSIGTQRRNGTTAGYVNQPYYNRAALKVASFAASGNWQPANCGSVGAPGNGQTGVAWMAGSTEACMNVP